ncbi:MAG: glycosyltransferase family 2 protein [Cyanobacteria bacterium P01_A01_bin.37]
MRHASSSFTVIIESENLASCRPEEIQNMFDSLLNQTADIHQANEVILGNNGLIPDEIANRIHQLIPNLKEVELPRELTYYQAKNVLAHYATGDILVFCDSDCVYESQWLDEILSTFSKKQDVRVVAGETVIDVKGYYSLAIAVNYMLHRQVIADDLKACKFYYLNNVAFRREYFIQQPLPDDIKIFRGACSVHSQQIIEQGIVIWKNFSARAYHLPPQNLRYYFFRFLIMGHDHYWLDKVLLNSSTQSKMQKTNNLKQLSTTKENSRESSFSTTQRQSLMKRFQRKYSYWVNQVNIYKDEYPSTSVDIICAIPIILLSQALITMGRLITQINSLFSQEPHWLYSLTYLLD